MPFIASYTSSYKARGSRVTDAWTPDSSGVYKATSGLSFWIDASDTSSYTEGWFGGTHFGLTSVTDKAGNNAITINNSGNTNDVPPNVFTNQGGGIDPSMNVFQFNSESLTTAPFTQVDSNGNHFSIALLRAGHDTSSNPFGGGQSSFWSLESNYTIGRRDYGLELGSASYFYGQLSLDSLDTPNRVNNDDVVQYGGIYNPPGPNEDQNLLRFDNYGNSQNVRGNGVWFIMAIVFNKTGNQILVRIDGENMFTPVDYDSTLNPDLAMRVAVNRTHDNNGDRNMFCQIAELMTFAAPPGTGSTNMSEVERLEGYLAHKWDLTNLLPITHPYRNYSLAATDDWNPSQGFPTGSGNMDTAFWIDASDEDSWNYGSGYIDSVTDKSGNYTLHIHDDTDLWRAGTLAGKYYFHFRGNTGISTTSSGNPSNATANKQADNGNHWAIGLVRWETITSSEDAFWHLDSHDGIPATNRDYAVESRGSSTTAGWTGKTDFGSGDISSTAGHVHNWTSGVDHNVWSIVAMYFNKTGNQIGARVNGSNAHSPINDYDTSISTNHEVHLFRSKVGTFLKGDLAEFFTFADIPGTGGTDISFIEIAEGYLAHKWNDIGIGQDVLNRLPNDHPFKSSAP